MTNDEIFRVILETKGADGLRELAREARATAKSVDETGTAVRKAGNESAAAGRAFQDGGRFIQDFAQGGVGGVLNNIEGLTRGLSALPKTVEGVVNALVTPAGMAGALTAIGTLLWVSSHAVKAFYDSVVDGSNKVPEATTNLGRMTDALAKNKKELDELKDKQSLTNTELAKYNGLLAAQPALEKAVAEERKKKADADKLDALRTKGAAESERDRAAQLQAGVGGQQKAIIDALAAEMLKRSQAANVDPEHEAKLKTDLAEANKPVRPNTSLVGRVEHDQQQKAAQKALDDYNAKVAALPAQAGKQAHDVVTSAVVGGKEDSLRQILDLLPKGGVRDDIVRSTTSDRTREDARNAGRQFLDSTLGQAARSIGDANRDARAAKAAQENNFAIDLQTNKALADKREKEAEAAKRTAAEKKRNDDETMRLRDQTNIAAQAAKTKADAETKRRRATIYDSVTAGPLDEQAGIAYGEAVSQGADPRQASRALSQDLAPRIRQQTGASPEDAKAVAQQVASEQAHVFNGTVQAVVGMGQSAASAVQDVIGAMGETRANAMNVKAQLDALRRRVHADRSNQTSYSESRLP